MKRYVIPAIVTFVLIGTLVSVAATQNNAPKSDSPLEGKAVVIQMDGVHFGVREHVRFESIGSMGFVVVPTKYKSEEEKYETWWPIEKVGRLRVFDSMEAAEAYDRKAAAIPDRDSAGNPDAK